MFPTLAVCTVGGINNPNSDWGLYRRHRDLLAQALCRHHQSTPVLRRQAVKSKREPSVLDSKGEQGG